MQAVEPAAKPMPKTPLSPVRLLARWSCHARRLAHDQRGATAVELALLAVPFFALVGAILETAMIFLASQVLDSAVQDASRYILTGQVQSISGYDVTNFQNAICSRLFGLFDCNNLRINVSTVTNFASATTTTSPLDTTDPTQWTLAESFDPGTANSVVLVRVYYKWPVFMNFAGFNLAQSSADHTFLLGAARVFKNEPFS